MSDSDLAAFALNRLGGETIPADVAILFAQREELMDRTEISMSADLAWEPWLDTRYLSATDRANPEIMANVKAGEEVCRMISFVAATDESEYFGYWRGPENRPIAQSPLVVLDNEGQFELTGTRTLAEAILSRATYDEESFNDLADWMRSLGITITMRSQYDLLDHTDGLKPSELHSSLYRQYSKPA